ncbi:MAG: DUF4194 domain-containing protein [Polaromonas sp.]
MSSLTDARSASKEQEGLPVDAAEDSDSLVSFAGDKGVLTVPTRRVLVQLLLGPVVDARRHPRLWSTLVMDEAVLRSRLHDLFLELVIDHQQNIAFTRQVKSDEIDIPVLLRRTPLTFLESAVLLFLRQRLTQADVDGERAVVDRHELVTFLQVYERNGNSDIARFDKQLLNAVEKAKKLHWISSLKNSEDRFEVSPTLKLLFTAEEIQALTQAYLDVASGKSKGNTMAAGDADEEE